jgi:AcrR family transcriptional regulator
MVRVVLWLAIVNTGVYGDRMDARLTPQDWVKAGLRALATDGASGLKVGTMATALGVSRGSFYWHFTDFADFRGQLLASWRDRTVDRVIREFKDDRAAPGRLKRLVKRAFFGKRGLDRAIRIWAADEPEVAAMVAAVDARRVGYMAQLLVEAGVAHEHAQPRAAFLYWAYLGQAIVMDPATAAVNEAALERIADLMED